jgi:hypothetical protein
VRNWCGLRPSVEILTIREKADTRTSVCYRARSENNLLKLDLSILDPNATLFHWLFVLVVELFVIQTLHILKELQQVVECMGCVA